MKSKKENKTFELFFKIWRNKYIKYQIINHLRLFKINQNQISFTSLKFKKYKYKEYCKSILLENDDFNETFFKNYIPDTLDTIEFIYFFNKPLINKHINYDYNSNYHCNLKSITFGYEFNQEINENLFPRSLTTLKFGGSFNQKLIPGIFKYQSKLISIEFGENFNNKGFPLPFNNQVFPNSLQILKFANNFSSPLIDQLSSLPNLTTLKFPNFLKLQINSTNILNSIFPSLKTINCNYNNQVEYTYGGIEWTFSITSLTLCTFNNNSSKILTCLPKTLKHLFLPNFNQPFPATDENSLPWKDLESLEFGGGDGGVCGGGLKFSTSHPFTQSVSFPNLKSLKISISNYKSLSINLFPKLESIIFLESISFTLFNKQKVDSESFLKILPNSLTYFELEFLNLNRPLNDPTLIFPSNLSTISITNSQNFKIFHPNLPLPPQLKKKIFNNNNNNNYNYNNKNNNDYY
ncbi:hypothetical protein ACTFIY_006974 [Dictyostelium cf. discoideum]